MHSFPARLCISKAGLELGAAPPALTAAPHHSGLAISQLLFDPLPTPSCHPELSPWCWGGGRAVCPGFLRGTAAAGAATWQQLLPFSSARVPNSPSDPRGGLAVALERGLPDLTPAPLVCPALGGPWLSPPSRGCPRRGQEPRLCQPSPSSCAKGSARRRHVLTLLIRSAAPVNWKWMQEARGGWHGGVI